MELYTKESLKEVIEKSKDEFYMPKVLFDHYKSLRLETKLAYVSKSKTSLWNVMFHFVHYMQYCFSYF